MNLVALVGRKQPNGDWEYVLWAPQPNITWKTRRR